MVWPREPHFSFEGDKLVWFGGLTSLYIVDLTSLTQIKIDNFIYDTPSGKPAQPMNAVADFNRQKYLVHYKVEREDIIVFHKHGREPDPHIIEEILPKYDTIKCFELNKKKLYVFVGGQCTLPDKKTGLMKTKGCISAMKFDKELKITAEIILPGSKCTTVNKILSSESHPDVLFVATDGPLFILAFCSS